MDVSKNRGTPKWMVYNGKSLLKWMIWGYPYFWKHPNRASTKVDLQAQRGLESHSLADAWCRALVESEAGTWRDEDYTGVIKRDPFWGASNKENVW